MIRWRRAGVDSRWRFSSGGVGGVPTTSPKFPQRLKPCRVVWLYGVAEATPFQSTDLIRGFLALCSAAVDEAGEQERLYVEPSALGSALCRCPGPLAQSGTMRAFGPEALCLSKLDNHLLQST